MKRSPMPARVTPLVRRARLASVTPLPPRTAPIPARRTRHAATGHKAVRDDLTPAQRATLHARSGGMCEAQMSPLCWVILPDKGWHACHRYNRARGGHNDCLACRYAGCAPCNYWQEDNPAAAEQTGHYVRTGYDPHRFPMCLPDGRIVRLGTDGLYLPIGGDAA